MSKSAIPSDKIPAENDDARSIDSPEADRRRSDLAKAAAKELHRAAKETDDSSLDRTSKTQEQ